MEVIIVNNKEEASQLATDRIIKVVSEKKKPVLGLATGSTPTNVYKKLIEAYKNSKVSFENVQSFNLDEYVGVGKDNKASYYHYMQEKLFSQINMKAENIHLPDGMADDIDGEATAYESKIAKVGPIDLQLLGIGRDGHIGFNEPTSSLQSRTRLKTLTEVTRKDNATYFESLEKVPYHVITMGIATIMEAKEIVLLAFGESKAQAVAQCIEGPITAMVPASILQFHPEVKMIIDQEAAQNLTRKHYYEWVYQKKPQWQRQKDYNK